ALRSNLPRPLGPAPARPRPVTRPVVLAVLQPRERALSARASPLHAGPPTDNRSRHGARDAEGPRRCHSLLSGGHFTLTAATHARGLWTGNVVLAGVDCSIEVVDEAPVLENRLVLCLLVVAQRAMDDGVVLGYWLSLDVEAELEFGFRVAVLRRHLTKARMADA